MTVSGAETVAGQLSVRCASTAGKRRVDGRVRPKLPRLRGLHRLTEKADGRDPIPRRFKDIIAELALGLGSNKPTEPQSILIRRAATLTLWCEQQEQLMAAGEDIDIAQFTTASNSLRRILIQLGEATQTAGFAKRW